MNLFMFCLGLFLVIWGLYRPGLFPGIIFCMAGGLLIGRYGAELLS